MRRVAISTSRSVTGDGPDLVVAPGFISHLEVGWELAPLLVASRVVPARHHL
jgi:hypothetical protein